MALFSLFPSNYVCTHPYYNIVYFLFDPWSSYIFLVDFFKDFSLNWYNDGLVQAQKKPHMNIYCMPGSWSWTVPSKGQFYQWAFSGLNQFPIVFYYYCCHLMISSSKFIFRITLNACLCVSMCFTPITIGDDTESNTVYNFMSSSFLILIWVCCWFLSKKNLSFSKNFSFAMQSNLLSVLQTSNFPHIR